MGKSEIRFLNGRGKIIMYIIIFTLIAMHLNPFLIKAEEKTDYAEIVFEEKPKSVNLNVTQNSFTPEAKDGKTGVKSAMASGVEFIYINISDDFIYDLPGDTPIDITIEYFDDAEGKISMHYDSSEPRPVWVGLSNNTIWQRADDVYMQNTQQWKKHTFHLEDLKAANRLKTGADIRVGVWDPETGYSAEDVIIRSIKIEKSEFYTPVKVEGTEFEQFGNIISIDEEMSLKCSLKNKTAEEIALDIELEICDMDGEVIGKKSHSCEMTGKEVRTEQIEVENPKRNGIYTIEGIISSCYKSNPDEKHISSFRTQFSISYISDAGEGDPTFGVCNPIAHKEYGEPGKVAEIMERGGMTFIRDDLRGGILENGKWKTEEKRKTIYKEMKESGIETVAILYGSGNYNEPPDTEEEIKAWGKWCGDIAADLKGIVNHFEIWNEYNIASFNKNMLSPESYAELLKYAYPAIKKANPEAVVLGIDCAGVDLTWMKRVFEAGGYDYLDVVSLHPYDWTGNFNSEKFISNERAVRELMSNYGEMKPLWITEFGFSSVGDYHKAGYSLEEQYQNHILSRALNKAYGMYDKYIMYCLFDREMRKEIEHNWGLLNYWIETDKPPYSAKPAFIGMTAFNHFVNKNTETKGIIADNGVYALNFYNNDLDQNVMLLQTGAGEKYKTIRLGCNKVTMYDGYGNKIVDMYSENGVYGFSIGRDPVWITGEFTDFAETDEKSAITTDDGAIEAVAGDEVSFVFKKNIDKELNISVDGASVVSNNGFVNNEAILKVRIPTDAKDEVKFNVAVNDAEGKTYFRKEFKMSIIDPIKISVTSESATSTSDNRWRVRVTVKNMHTNSEINGELKIVGPESISGSKTIRRFDKLKAGKTRTFLITLPERVTKRVINLEMQLKLESGFETSVSQMLSFTSSGYAYQKPIIDGILSNNEWNGNWFGADEEKDVKQIGDWHGADDISFSGTSMWDEKNFYFTAIATDDVHWTAYSPTGPDNMWRGDSFQVGFNDKDELNPVDYSSFTELGMAYVPGMGDTIYRFSSLYGQPLGVVENAEIVIKRYDTYTLYECRIPWTEIFGENYVFEYDTPFRFSVLANDNDGQGRGWIEYTGGIGTQKTVTLFGEMTFRK